MQIDEALQKTWASVMPELRNGPRNLYTDETVAAGQDPDISSRAIELSTTKLDRQVATSIRFAYITVDFIFRLGQAWLKVSVTDINGTNAYFYSALHTSVRHHVVQSILRALLNETSVRPPHVFTIPYARGVTLTDKIRIAAEVYRKLFESGASVTVTNPQSPRISENKVSIVPGQVDHIIPHLSIRGDDLCYDGFPVDSLYDLIPARLSAVRPDDFPKRIVQTGILTTQWAHLQRPFSAMVNSTYEITSNPVNVSRVVAAATAQLETLEAISAKLATSVGELKRILVESNHRCLIIKTPSSRGAGTLHVYQRDAQRQPDKVIERLFRQMRKNYHSISQDATFPVLVSECVAQKEIKTSGKITRYYDARFVVFLDDEYQLHACPAMVRRLEIPDRFQCSNAEFSHPRRGYRKLETHHPLANNDVLARMNMNQDALFTLASNAAEIGRRVAVESSNLR